MSSRFNTLLLREWMQHKRGWLITMLLPPSIFLTLLTVGNAEGNPDASPLGIALLFLVITTGSVAGIAWLSAMFQLPGLVRRDNQDRSIEFWLSLPAGHSESIGATLLAHAVLVPLAGLLVGYAFSGLIVTGLVLKMMGTAGWQSVPWLQVVSMSLPLLGRALFGVFLMSLWLAPLMLIVMAASAWLKRWGVPAVILTVGVGGLVLDKLYGLPIVWRWLSIQQQGAANALLADYPALEERLAVLAPGGSDAFNASAWALQDSWIAVQHLASPHFIGGLVVAAGCFALLVLKRSRTA